MRIDRIESSRHKKGRVLVFLEDGACLKITEQELLDFGLRSGDELSPALLAKLKEAAGISNTKATAADLIGKRAMSRAGLEKKLREKGASQAEARSAGEWREAIGALNDAEYAAILVRHYGQMGYGPRYVQEKLREKGVPRELWEDALEELPEAAEQIDRFLSSKLQGRDPDPREKKRLTDALLCRGYGRGDVKAGWSRYGAEVSDDEP